MNVLIAGMPRAGSMWTYNVTRDCLLAAGKSVLPKTPPVEERDTLIEALNTRTDPNSVYCIKTHERIPLNAPDTLFICNYRDVRDALVSYMRFMECDFEFGMRTVRWMMDLTDYYLSAHPSRLLDIRYDEISSSNNIRLIERICEFIGTPLPTKSIKNISQRYAKTRIKTLVGSMNKIQIAEDGRSGSGTGQDTFLAAPNADGSYRAYHKSTGFQARHITHTKKSEWKQFFSEEQKSILMEITSEWLSRYRFPL